MIKLVFLNKYKALPVQVRASFWFLICAFLQKSVSALTTPIFTRMLSTAEYGIYNVFTSWETILNCLITLNLCGGMYAQNIVKLEGEERKAFSSSMQGLNLLLVGVWAIVYSILHIKVNSLLSLSTIQIFCMLTMMWANSVFSFWAVEQRVDLNYRKLVCVTLSLSILSPIASIGLITRMQDKVTARIIGSTIIYAIIGVILFVVQVHQGKVFFSKKNTAYALRFCIPLIPHYLSQMLLNSSDRIMIQKMIGDSEAGIYSLAHSVSFIMTLFNTALLQTIEPWIFKKIKEHNISVIKEVAYPSFVFIAFANVILITFAPEVISFFSPSAYHEAIYVVPPIAMSVFFMFMYSFFALFEFYFEKPHYITIATLCGATTNIILNYIFIKLYGYYAAGYTTLVCFAIYAMMHYLFMKRIANLYLSGEKIYNGLFIIKISVVFLIVSFAVMKSYSNTSIRYMMILLIIVAIFLFRKKAYYKINRLLKIIR